MEVTSSLGTVKETEEKMAQDLEILRRKFHTTKTDADNLWSELGRLWI